MRLLIYTDGFIVVAGLAKGTYIMNENFDEILKTIFEYLDKLPGNTGDKLKEAILEIKEKIGNNRPPRIMIIGRRGAGKSSLINALLKANIAPTDPVESKTGAAKTYTCSNGLGSIEIVDTRGFADGNKPEDAIHENSIEELKATVKGSPPDAILFLCKASDVSSHIDSDLSSLKEIWDHVLDEHGGKIPIIALVTKVDELPPVRVEPPFENEEKQANIERARGLLDKKLQNHEISTIKVLAVSALTEFDEGNITYHRWWNIDILAEYLIEILPKEAQFQMARASMEKSVQKKFAKPFVKIIAGGCAAIAAVPIPLADIVPITSAQIFLVMAIAYVSGRDFSKENAIEFLAVIGANVGIGMALREAARVLLKFMPVGGNMISGGIAFAGTMAIGEAAILYFIDKKNIDEVKSSYASIFSLNNEVKPE